MAGTCRIVAGVSGSPGSVHALRHTAGLARHHDATLIPLLAWMAPGGNLSERNDPCPELRQLWEDQAWQRLWDTLDTAFGGLPAVLRGKPGKALTLVARQPGDLLVIGAGRQGPLRQLGGFSVSRYCLAHACCPVLAIPPGAGPASRLRSARLGVPSSLDPGHHTSHMTKHATS
jgi:nucleotide-binding universal stress UspA family protein